jgi:hypothetical protein
VIEEEPVLEPSRAVQADVAEALAQAHHPALERNPAGSAERDPERGAEHRRVRRGLQDRLVFADQLAVLFAPPSRPALTLGRLAICVIDVENPLANLPECLAVPDPLGVEDRIGGKPRPLEGVEEKLGGARELGLLGQGACAEHRLVDRALLRLHLEGRRLGALLDHRLVAESPEVRFERLVGEGALGAGEDEGVRLPGAFEAGLGDASGGAASEKPLQLRGPRPPQADRAGQTREDPLLGACQLGEFGAGDRRGGADPRQVLEASARAI